MIAAQLNELAPLADQHQAAAYAKRTGSDAVGGKVTRLKGEKELIKLHVST